MISPLHPKRCFQVDSKLKSKLANIRNRTPKIDLAKFNSEESIVIPIIYEIDLPTHLFKNLKFIQGYLYNYLQNQTQLSGFLDFWDNSKQIFQFDSDLSFALSNTSIDDVPWEEIHLPYQNFYISFGDYGQKPFKTNNPYVDFRFIIDGAYVRTFTGESLIFPRNSIIIEFTSRLTQPTYDEAINNHPPNLIFSEPIYSFIISGKTGQTIKEAIDIGEENFLGHCDKMDMNNFEMSLKLSQQLDLHGMGFEKQTPNRDKYFRGKEQILPNLDTLFNCIFYLTQFPNSISTQYTAEPPKELLNKLKNADNEITKKKIEKKLSDHGFTKIKFVSDNVVKQNIQSLSTDREVSPHWRRGHWRRQAFGNSYSEHKFIWIHPTFVRKDKGELEGGHIYEVDK